MAKRPVNEVVHGIVRFTITINGQNYSLIPLSISPQGDCPSFLLKKRGTDARYTVAVTNRGVSCTCPDFTSRKRPDDCCKHIKALNAVWLLR